MEACCWEGGLLHQFFVLVSLHQYIQLHISLHQPILFMDLFLSSTSCNFASTSHLQHQPHTSPRPGSKPKTTFSRKIYVRFFCMANPPIYLAYFLVFVQYRSVGGACGSSLLSYHIFLNISEAYATISPLPLLPLSPFLPYLSS